MERPCSATRSLALGLVRICSGPRSVQALRKAQGRDGAFTAVSSLYGQAQRQGEASSIETWTEIPSGNAALASAAIAGDAVADLVEVGEHVPVDQHAGLRIPSGSPARLARSP